MYDKLKQSYISVRGNQQLIKKVPFFRDIDQNLLTSIAMILVPEYFNDGDFIIEEGTLGDKMYLIATGKVEIVINGVAKAKLGVGLFFGG